jgi:hypothetical protein
MNEADRRANERQQDAILADLAARKTFAMS